jgi:hypothetical protein
LALTPEEAKEATADLDRLADELAALADLLGAPAPKRPTRRATLASSRRILTSLGPLLRMGDRADSTQGKRSRRWFFRACSPRE